MAQIKRMERGKICPMPGRPHYNHGYRLFLQLAQDYADIIIAQTRNDLAKAFPRPTTHKSSRSNPP